MLWEDLQKQPKLTVSIKGTFTIETNQAANVSAEQLPILIADEHYGKDVTSAVRFESDMVPFTM
jgi:hypothetical protein